MAKPPALLAPARATQKPAESALCEPAPTIITLLRWSQAQLTAQFKAQLKTGTTATAAEQTHSAEVARLEAELLLATATGLTRTSLIAWPERQPDEPERRRFEQMLHRRMAGEPIAYILGEREFRGLLLRVSPDTLIPRPETELLVDWALDQYPPNTAIRCIDLGAGCGAIALAIALERPHWQVFALEQSAGALAIAAANRQRLQADWVQFIQGDWLSALAPRSLDLILANPPYVAAQDPHLAQGDLPFEPISALVGGADGLAAIHRIAADLPSRLAPGGRVAIEHGWNQGDAVCAIFNQVGLEQIETHRDLSGHHRFTSAKRNPPSRSSAA